ncbi:MAG: 16S rRNA (cytidine(1402)-2'-O)-methyltransferase [Gammaproteobacteria bacterium RIFCSPLOWO2_02_FULL_47_50]|jgi:16S rRNA (cytidine1402-2'-O)-methyltransferase|nr:MAG: 16S rRNA (cytidine(1402)-2'-O)-methyltransferase [Gammaproteobacteria bacterium RIFCSPLOWO2_01_FULL_47_190]OGT75275.1 MAG: 16S rRNA (cytidine(1402)-2'-O)-methyltransferase [Gammaproteobacteria bacterium RIFCSPLOWO2_12_47_11]OGT78722.1 MAG: 16S rRNA (cytidine(1402)-2'-O)-methyltransferase [Gammaproteobacteria bacterium RIFCSPLOWO2_02_FULL_47_50]OGT87473.1 MAG: 16S rRNA (cytidine(1402)-2'-O)-methyltransferase [Gammaproteobacteria bacterium RIFCSPLOWO2_12_FULL_47_76]
MISAGLYVVATPIGNLEDISARAVRTLNEVDLILAEDSRHSGKLLQHLGVHTPVQAYHDHNELKVVDFFLERLRANQSIALISDAGTPLINDPGYHLVIAAHKHGIRVIPVPGPSAVISALSVSGLPTDRFVYEGFLPNKQAARRKQLAALAGEQRTLVFYEVPHRICACIGDMVDYFGPDRIATLAKEITKHFETIRNDTLAGILDWLQEDPLHQKGEFVLMVHGAAVDTGDELESVRVLKILLHSLPVKEAVAAAAKIMDGKKNRLYRLAVAIKDKG